MKNFRTLAVTLGIGSAVAWLAGNRRYRTRLIEKSKAVIQKISRDKSSGDDNNMRYI